MGSRVPRVSQCDMGRLVSCVGCVEDHSPERLERVVAGNAGEQDAVRAERRRRAKDKCDRARHIGRDPLLHVGWLHAGEFVFPAQCDVRGDQTELYWVKRLADSFD
jgi:hypothetical protein